MNLKQYLIGGLIGSLLTIGAKVGSDYLTVPSPKQGSCITIDDYSLINGGAGIEGKCTTSNGDMADIIVTVDEDAKVDAMITVNGYLQMASIRPEQEKPLCFGLKTRGK